MARRFSGLRNRMIRSGRKTFWFTSGIFADTMGAASTAVLISQLNAAALALRPFTVIRTRGWFGFRSDQTAASEDQDMMIGSIVVSDQAVAIGITAIPTPVTDDQSNWIVLEGGSQRFEFVSGVGIVADQMVRYVIDSKAMRKVEEGQTIAFVTETGASSAGTSVRSYMRQLIKLH